MGTGRLGQLRQDTRHWCVPTEPTARIGAAWELRSGDEGYSLICLAGLVRLGPEAEVSAGAPLLVRQPKFDHPFMKPAAVFRATERPQLGEFRRVNVRIELAQAIQCFLGFV